MSVADGIAQPRDADRVVPVERGVDRRGNHHAAERGDRRQRHLAAVGELACDDFALDLEPHQQEEDRHQQVVDPDQQGLVELERADLQLDRGLQERLVQVEERGVRRDHGEHAGDHEQDAARGFELQEFAQGGDRTGVVWIAGSWWRPSRGLRSVADPVVSAPTSAECARHGPHVDGRSTGGSQRRCRLERRAAGGDDVVDQDDVPAGDDTRIGDKRAAQVAGTFPARESDLRRRTTHPAQATAGEPQVEQPRHDHARFRATG